MLLHRSGFVRDGAVWARSARRLTNLLVVPGVWKAVALVAALHTVPFLAAPYVTTQDGAAHLYNAELLRTYDAPHSTTLQALFEPRHGVLSNRVAQLTLTGLGTILPVHVAEKVLVSAYILLFVSAAAYAVRSVVPGHTALLSLLLPLMLAYPFQMGFYAFSVSVIGYLLAIGYWLRTHAAFGVRPAIVLGALLVATFLWHPFSLVAAIPPLALGLLVAAVRRTMTGGTLDRAGLLRELGCIALALLPACVLFVGFRDESEATPPHMLIPGPGRIIEQLTTWPVWISFSRWELPLFGLLLGTLAVAAMRHLWRKVRQRQWREADALLAGIATYLLLYVAVPDAILGGGYVHVRLMLYASLATAVWLATQLLGQRERRVLAATGTVVAALLLAIYAGALRHHGARLREYTSALRHVPPHSTLLALSAVPSPEHEGPRRDTGVQPMRHAGGRIGAGSDVALLNNYQADKPHFAFMFREGRNPYASIGHIEDFPWCPLTLDAYERSGGLPIDVVVVWSPPEERWMQRPAMTTLVQELRGRYELVFVSQPQGSTQVWLRRGAARVAGGPGGVGMVTQGRNGGKPRRRELAAAMR
ncbi:MAG TPA: hypothetical protein VIL35_04095 [Vicinamibacterales bacterium]